jgi:hypothetical protein
MNWLQWYVIIGCAIAIYATVRQWSNTEDYSTAVLVIAAPLIIAFWPLDIFVVVYKLIGRLAKQCQ